MANILVVLVVSFSCIILSIIAGIGFWLLNKPKNYYIDNDDEKHTITLSTISETYTNVKQLVLNPKSIEDTKKVQILSDTMEFVEKDETYDEEFTNPKDVTIQLVDKTTSETCNTYYKFDSSVQQCNIDLKSIGNLVGHYTADSWDQTNKKWKDLSGKNNDATIEGTGTKQGNLITGTTTTKVTFPVPAILPTSYTLFHVTKYNGSAKGRIIDGVGTNWFSGHNDNKSGVAYHSNSGKFTEYVDLHGSSLVLSTDQLNLYRSNGVKRNIVNGGQNKGMGINTGAQFYGDSVLSDWAIGEIIVYDGELSEDKIKVVEKYLADKYSITMESSSFTNTFYNKKYSIL